MRSERGPKSSVRAFRLARPKEAGPRSIVTKLILLQRCVSESLRARARARERRQPIAPTRHSPLIETRSRANLGVVKIRCSSAKNICRGVRGGHMSSSVRLRLAHHACSLDLCHRQRCNAVRRKLPSPRHPRARRHRPNRPDARARRASSVDRTQSVCRGPRCITVRLDASFVSTSHHEHAQWQDQVGQRKGPGHWTGNGTAPDNG